MVDIFDVQPYALAKEVASSLKGKITPPKWAVFIKTGAHKERPPLEQDWWYIRAASVLRTVYKNKIVGVSKLRSKYGGAKNRGVRPSKFTKASGAVLRKILQQLETAGFLKLKKEGLSKGRVITPAGIALLHTSAQKVAKK